MCQERLQDEEIVPAQAQDILVVLPWVRSSSHLRGTPGTGRSPGIGPPGQSDEEAEEKPTTGGPSEGFPWPGPQPSSWPWVWGGWGTRCSARSLRLPGQAFHATPASRNAGGFIVGSGL